MVPEQAKWFLRHVKGCGEPAFYMAQEPFPGVYPVAQMVWFADGSQPKPGDPFKCGACGALLDATPNVKDLMVEYCEER